jgi:predicted metal-dependent phosphoesterase TrpH
MPHGRPVTRGAMHVHTRRSFDSLAHPRRIVAEALRRGLDFLAVSDHDTLAGALEVRDAARREGGRLAVLVGVECRSRDGDLICLGVKREVATRDPAALIEATHRQGGLVILPHPMRGHHRVRQLAEAVDLIEAVNARCSPAANARAAALARRCGKPIVGGGDAHMVHQIRHCTIEFEGRWDLSDPATARRMLLTAPRRIVLRRGADLCADPLCQLTALLRPVGLLARIREGVALMRDGSGGRR